MSTGNLIQNYLQRDIPCDCGRTHNCQVKTVEIGRHVLEKIPALLRKENKQKAYIIADKNTYQAAGERLVQIFKKEGTDFSVYILRSDEVVADETALGEIVLNMPSDADVMISVGAGTINDLCKFASYKLGIDYIAVASAPSMDGFASVGAALIANHLKTTYQTHTPIAIFGDTEVLKNAPMDMITAGFADILAKYTCLLDWKVSHLINDEYYCEMVVNMVKDAIAKVMSLADKILERDDDAIESIMEALVLTGIAMSFVGISRPASGSEHHMSHYWEMKFLMQERKPVLHGIKVGIGTVASSCMYHRLLEEKLDFDEARKKAQEFDKKHWEQEMHRVFELAADGVIALENEVGKNDSAGHAKRIKVIEEKWPEITAAVKEWLPQAEEIENILLSVRLPINPLQVGVDAGLIFDCVRYAKEVRNRYTILQLLWDLGLSEQYADMVREYFTANKQANYVNLIKKQTQSRIDKIKCFVLDMDGTIYLENRLFPFAKEALKAIKDSGREYCFFTNNSSNSKKNYLTKLNNMGIPVTEDRLFISTHVIMEFLKKNHPGASIYLVGTENLRQEFVDNGFLLTENKPDMVVLGFDTSLTYEKLRKACDYIRHGALYYGINPDKNCPVENLEYIPDCGSIAKLIETSTDRYPAEFFGKPSKRVLEYVMERTGYQEEEIAMIGDRLYTDIATATDTKATSILVLTGESTLEDIEKQGIQPDIIFNSLEDLIPYL